MYVIMYVCVDILLYIHTDIYIGFEPLIFNARGPMVCQTCGLDKDCPGPLGDESSDPSARSSLGFKAYRVCLRYMGVQGRGFQVRA